MYIVLGRPRNNYGPEHESGQDAKLRLSQFQSTHSKIGLSSTHFSILKFFFHFQNRHGKISQAQKVLQNACLDSLIFDFKIYDFYQQKSLTTWTLIRNKTNMSKATLQLSSKVRRWTIETGNTLNKVMHIVVMLGVMLLLELDYGD